MKDARESVREVAKFKEHILKNLYTMIVRDANYFKFYRKTCLGTHTPHQYKQNIMLDFGYYSTFQSFLMVSKLS